ncbi:MAG: DNA cytosine methyltransferase [Marinilabiliaceae bacterium]
MRMTEYQSEFANMFTGNDRAYVTNREAISGKGTLQGLVSQSVASSMEEFLKGKDRKDIEMDIPFPPPTHPDFRFIDLFAGIGGFRIAAQRAGGECVFSSEFNPHAQAVYEKNYGDYPFGDIKGIPAQGVPAHDLLTAGFPCQPFSISGKMKGFEDTRGTLIYEVFRIAAEKKPKVILLENVKQLVYHDKGNTLSTILKGLENLGYKPTWKVLNASDFGVPQNRERIIIVANKDRVFDFSKVETLPRKTIRDIADTDSSKFEYLDEPYTLLNDVRPQASGLLFVGYRNKNIRKNGIRPGTEHLSRVHKQPNRIYSIDGIHPALPSQETSGRFWVLDGDRVRKLTIDECYRLMGFPENFIKDKSLGDEYKQCGNSVCVPMIEAIVKQIKNSLVSGD